jgi:hypothetical protein
MPIALSLDIWPVALPCVPLQKLYKSRDITILFAVMSMGFMEGETRLGLRACSGNVENAVAHIMKRREVSTHVILLIDMLVRYNSNICTSPEIYMYLFEES